jgi:two-component system response regulator AtoC
MVDSLLIIEDEPLLGSELREEFAEAGWDAVLAADMAQAERLLFTRNLKPLAPGGGVGHEPARSGNALDLLEKVRAEALAGEWIFLTAYGGVPESVWAFKLGAFDFLQKLCEPERLQLVVAGAARSARAQRRLHDEERAAAAVSLRPPSPAGALPPLREREEDLEDLLPLFIDEFNARSGQRVARVPATMWRRLAAYD